MLIPVQLTGSENYGRELWPIVEIDEDHTTSQVELGFVTGTCTKNSFKSELHEDKDTCNAIVLSWILNTISPNLLSGIGYASNAHLVWEDLRERFDKVNRMRNFQLHRHRVIATLSQEQIMYPCISRN